MCIRDRITGDTFGPLVGYKLKRLFRDENCAEVIGDLDNLVYSDNANQVIREIDTNYENPLIIAIDSALTDCCDNIGNIVVANGGLKLGAGLNKRFNCVGDVSIKGIVARNMRAPNYNLRILQNIPLNLVMNMADTVARGIYNVIKFK